MALIVAGAGVSVPAIAIHREPLEVAPFIMHPPVSERAQSAIRVHAGSDVGRYPNTPHKA